MCKVYNTRMAIDILLILCYNSTMTKHESYDLIVVGGGPAGLSAAINAESERVNTIVLDSAYQFGGQAGTSSLIENYPAFPEGVSGKRLASLMIDQALKFDTEFLAPWRAKEIEKTDEGLVVSDGGEQILGKAVLLSSGVEYRRLVVPNLAAYLGRGVSYGSPRPADIYDEKQVYVVGGANSAGQAAMHLSKFTNCTVNMLVRGKSIEDKMSSYLHERISETENIEVHTETEIESVDGDGHLKEIVVRTPGGNETLSADELFIMIGAAPRTDWLPGVITRDNAGFVKAGADIEEEGRHEFLDSTGRLPLTHETVIPGLFTAGDVRFGTTKRVASAVGDGATVIPDVHRYLATLG
jgi:thioredoxin reductase (NADPH)